MVPFNTHKDGSGGWYIITLCGKFLKRFDWRGRPIWTDEGCYAHVMRDDPTDTWASFNGLEQENRFLQDNPCAQAMKVHATIVGPA